MRTLIVIGVEHYIRNLVEVGAFEQIEDEETFYVAAARYVKSPVPVGRGTYLGTVRVTKNRHNDYQELRKLLLASYRFRSRTQRIKLRFLPRGERWRLRVQSLPLLRRFFVRRPYVWILSHR